MRLHLFLNMTPCILVPTFLRYLLPPSPVLKTDISGFTETSVPIKLHGIASRNPSVFMPCYCSRRVLNAAIEDKRHMRIVKTITLK